MGLNTKRLAKAICIVGGTLIVVQVFPGAVVHPMKPPNNAKTWDPKAEWLKYSGLDYSVRDRWLRDKIAGLFDLKNPNDAQKRLLSMADLRLTLADLPPEAYPNHKAELMALAEAEFGSAPAR